MNTGSRTDRLELASRIVASRDQVSCPVDGETVILSLKTGEYYGLNSVAAHIWTLIQEARTVWEVRDTLLDAYEGIDEETCTAQVLTALNDMLAMELIERAV